MAPYRYNNKKLKIINRRGRIAGMRILAIETSCDDTAIAIVDAKPRGGRKIPNFRVISNIISSQTKIHKKYGGVVPGLAKREHQKNLVPVLVEALRNAKFRNSEREIRNSKQIINSKFKILNTILAREPELLEQFLKVILKIKTPKVDLIAVTHGPGLEPALWAGVNFARALSYWWNIPLLGVNHMEGHIAANFLPEIGGNPKSEARNPKLLFSAIALAVSGGHTQLILVKDIGKYKLLGETVDDAAGEAFDKVARMFGLGFPGGPEIAKQASQFKSEIRNPKSETNSKSQILNSKLSITLPRPMLHSKDYNFSFSGLKTAVLYDYKKRSAKLKKSKEYIQEMSFAFQQAVIDVLIAKTIRAAKEYRAKTIMLGGGVAANTELREQLGEKIKEELPRLRRSFARGYGSTKQGFGGQAITNYQLPSVALATDNAAMIAAAAYFHRKQATLARWKTLKANGNLKIS